MGLSCKTWTAYVCLVFMVVFGVDVTGTFASRPLDHNANLHNHRERHAVLSTQQSPLEGLSTEHPIGPQYHSASGNSLCTSMYLNVPVKATNTHIDIKDITDQSFVTAFLQEYSYRTDASLLEPGVSPVTIEKSYRIYAELCVPESAQQASKPIRTVQLLTHGLTLDHTYWDMVPGNSYVDAAVASGFATLNYDRVGTGFSDHPDPVNEVQTGVHIEVTRVLARMLRNGEIGSHPFDKVVGVGHSTGSWYSHAAAAKDPDAFDAYVMTGVSTYTGSAVMTLAACAFQIANLDPSGKFTGLPNGYLAAPALPSIHQFDFYHYPDFDEHVLQSQFQARQTIAIGDLFTLIQAIGPSGYTGPVATLTGEYDLVTCGGDCTSGGCDVVAQVQQLFVPNATDRSDRSSLIVPRAGHNINGHHGAEGTFDWVMRWLADNEIS